MAQQLTVGELAAKTGIQECHIRKLCDRKLIPFGTLGRYRAFQVKDIPKIREAAVRAGFLKPDPAAAQPCQV